MKLRLQLSWWRCSTDGRVIVPYLLLPNTYSHNLLEVNVCRRQLSLDVYTTSDPSACICDADGGNESRSVPTPTAQLIISTDSHRRADHRRAAGERHGAGMFVVHPSCAPLIHHENPPTNGSVCGSDYSYVLPAWHRSLVFTSAAAPSAARVYARYGLLGGNTNNVCVDWRTIDRDWVTRAIATRYAHGAIICHRIGTKHNHVRSF